ncbi:MAG TPA: hypothetical protein VF310_09395 [Vicinamibacteria bacterium]
MPRPKDEIARLVQGWEGRSDGEVLEGLRGLAPLADEGDPCWTREYWSQVAYPYVALGDVAARRRLRAAIRLLLDRACFGDPGEIMRGLRHSLEAIVDPDWEALVEDCLAAARSARRGTRLWALDTLAMLDDPRARPVFEAALGDPASLIREVAEIGLERLAERRG